MVGRWGSFSWLWWLGSVVIAPAWGINLAKFEPERGCYIGAFVKNDPHVNGDMAEFEAVIGKKHASYFTYVRYGAPFPMDWVEKVKAVGAAPHIAWEPNEGLHQVRDDAYLREWAAAARQAGCPIFLRFASEMNGRWTAYHGNPSLYKQKWRLVHRVMAEVAPNVALVWAPFCMPQDNITAYYPGDAYVDWVGVNIYSVHHHNNNPRHPSGHEDPRELLRFVYDTYSPRRPIMICEYAATHYCRACGQATVGFALEKMQQLYRSLPTDFPRVKMINWFNWDTITGGAADNNYALTDNELIKGQYQKLIRSSYFLSEVLATPAASPEVRIAQEPLTTAPGPPPPAAVASEPSVARTQPAPPPAVLVAQEPAPLKSDTLEPVAAASEPTPTPTPARAVLSESGVTVLGLAAGQEVTGRLTLRVAVDPSLPVRYLALRVDGQMSQMTNRVPYRFDWNASRWEPGEHALEVVVRTPDGEERQVGPVPVIVRHGSST